MRVKMIFKKLYIFAPGEKTARVIPFEEGINVVTSSQKDGTNRGKSVIMRSLYYTLGAETFFDNKWDVGTKVYVVQLSIDDVEYYVYRHASLFKFFDAKYEMIFSACHTHELAEKLFEYFKFTVMLPNRASDKLEITPPVYNYLPFYLDQDHYDCSKFASFGNLQQYKDYKDKVLYSHFGAYDSAYFELVRKKERINDSIAIYMKRREILLAMLENINAKLEIGSYADNVEDLNKEIAQYREQYSYVMEGLNRSKNKLIDLRNALFEFEQVMREVKVMKTKNEKAIMKLVNHTCPECGSAITNTISLKSKKYNLGEDILLIQADLEESILKIQTDVEKEEIHYKELLDLLHQYEEQLQINTSQVKDILRHKGLCEIKTGIISEKVAVNELLSNESSELSEIEKSLKKYGVKKKMIQDRYYEMLLGYKMKFGLNEINPEKFKKISSNFSASGSSKNIATVIWHMTLMYLRKEFNPDAIVFPVVFDSPNNVETDDEKKNALIQFILDNSCVSEQMIFSVIGFDADAYKNDAKINIINLKNNRYQLLNKRDYEDNKELLTQLSMPLSMN